MLCAVSPVLYSPESIARASASWRRGDNFRLRNEHFEDYLVREFCDSVEAADELLEPARG